MAARSIERVNVNLPKPLLEDLRKLVPRSRRSEVIARATARELRRLKIAAMFEDLAREPLWGAEEHGAFKTGAAIDSFVSELRTRGTWPPPSPARRKAARE